MTKASLIAIAVLGAALASPVLAQTAAPAASAPRPAPPPRPRAPAVATATLLAQEGLAACLANGYRVTALVTDVTGAPIVMLTQDGGALRMQQLAATKVATVARYKAPSAVIAERIKTDPALDAETKADPAIGRVFGGAVPLMAGGEMIGVFAVSGGPGANKDEACVAAALAKHGALLK